MVRCVRLYLLSAVLALVCSAMSRWSLVLEGPVAVSADAAACLMYWSTCDYRGLDALPDFLLRQIYLFVGIHFSASERDLPDYMTLSVVCGSQNMLVLWLLEESMTHVFYCRRCHAALFRGRRCCWCDGFMLCSAQRLQLPWRLRLRVVLAIMASRQSPGADWCTPGTHA